MAKLFNLINNLLKYIQNSNIYFAWTGKEIIIYASFYVQAHVFQSLNYLIFLKVAGILNPQFNLCLLFFRLIPGLPGGNARRLVKILSTCFLTSLIILHCITFIIIFRISVVPFVLPTQPHIHTHAHAQSLILILRKSMILWVKKKRNTFNRYEIYWSKWCMLVLCHVI